MLSLRLLGKLWTRRSARKYLGGTSPLGAMALKSYSRTDGRDDSRLQAAAGSVENKRCSRTRGTPKRIRATVTLTAFALMFVLAPGSLEQGKVEAQETEESAKPTERKLPQVDAGAWALVDAETGVYLAGKNPDKRLPVASTTNVMTALITFEEETDLDEEVAISAQAERFVGYTYSNVGLMKGEHLSVRELLVAALIPSGTEAVYSLAEHLGGGGGEAGVERFVQRMNKKAESMGLKNTHFENPAGLDASSHYSSARDLATITRKAMEYRAFADIVDTQQTTISTQNRVIDVFNTNDLLYGYKKANGVKTGASPKGGFSLVASATSGDESYVAVVLEAESEEYRSEAAREALEYGFDGYKRRPLVDEGQTYSEAHLPYRQQQSVELVAATDVLGPAGPGLEVERRIRVGETPMAAKADQELGIVEVLVNGQRIGSSSLVTKRGYNEASLWTKARYAVAWPAGRVLSALDGRVLDGAGGEVRRPPGRHERLYHEPETMGWIHDVTQDKQPEPS
jgi:serine-type D-Ala-D-Ala carboxypeptidase (penicillin-binding protein 5/6)